jgi:hypothetical protein
MWNVAGNDVEMVGVESAWISAFKFQAWKQTYTVFYIKLGSKLIQCFTSSLEANLYSVLHQAWKQTYTVFYIKLGSKLIQCFTSRLYVKSGSINTKASFFFYLFSICMTISFHWPTMDPKISNDKTDYINKLIDYEDSCSKNILYSL